MDSQDDKQPNKRHSSEEPMEDSINTIKEKRRPDQLDLTERANVNIEHTNVNIAQMREEIADRQFDRELKGEYANKLFYFLTIYTITVMAIVVAQGIGRFSLHDIPLSLLISSIVIMTIGVGRFVVKSVARRK